MSPTAPPPLTLRRSKRKLDMASSKEVSKVFVVPPPTKKARKGPTKKVQKSKTLKNPPRLQLMSLSYDLQDKLLQYLDVQVRLLRGLYKSFAGVTSKV